MNGPAFFDTNSLIYADDATAPKKQSRAIQLITDCKRRGRIVRFAPEDVISAIELHRLE